MALLETGLLERTLADLEGDGSLVHVFRVPARDASPAEPQVPLADRIRDRLGVEQLWTHQAAALDLIHGGRDVAVATGTASGKSLCFHAPVAEAASEPIRAGTSLLLFPTKALA